MEALLTNAAEIYAFHYFGIIILVSLLEWGVPRKVAAPGLRVRWLSNFGITLIDAAVLRLLFPVAGFGWALYCAERGWGLLNQMFVPAWVAFIVTVLVLDLATFMQHYLLHHVPLLWRMHRTHHSDHDCDFSTAARFHPVEVVYTTAILSGAIAALGLPAVPVFVSQLLTTAISFAEHGNVRITASLERVLKHFIVTPDMHRIHHSADVSETNSNYGTLFPWWDRLFGTYVDEPAAGDDGVIFGLGEFNEQQHQTLLGLLAQPFARDAASEPRFGSAKAQPYQPPR